MNTATLNNMAHSLNSQSSGIAASQMHANHAAAMAHQQSNPQHHHSDQPGRLGHSNMDAWQQQQYKQQQAQAQAQSKGAGNANA
jgi:hypothetical protein